MLGLTLLTGATLMTSQMLDHVTQTYFSSTRCLAFISDHQWTELHLSVPVFNIHFNPMNNHDNAVLYKEALESGCTGFIASVENVSQVLSALLNAARYTVQRENKRYLIITKQAPESVLSLPQLRFIPDLIVACISNDSAISIWTHQFSGHTTQTQNTPLLLDTWSSGKFKFNANYLYPDKLKDLQGKELKFATFNYPPYAIIENVYDGTEMRLGMELARHLNFTWAVETDESEWGEIFEDASGNGILGTVSEDRADFGFGALYLWYHEYQFLDFSVPYIRTGITCLAPKPAQLSGWRAPTLPFSSSLWLAVAVSLIVAATSICALANLQNFLHILVQGKAAESSVLHLCKPLNCILLVVGMSALAPSTTTLHNPSALKHCLTWFLLQCLLLATCYSSSLVSFMTVPRFVDPIDTAQDIATKKLNWAATHDAWAFSLREASDPVHSTVYQLFRHMTGRDLHDAAISGHKLAFSIERLPAGNFAVGDYLYDDEALSKLRLMREDLYWEMVVTVVRKGSPYLHKLNTLIHRLLDSGILLFWEGEVARKFLSSRYQLIIQNSLSHDVTGATTLALKHVQGVFLILAIGLVVATVVFIFEILKDREIKWAW